MILVIRDISVLHVSWVLCVLTSLGRGYTRVWSGEGEGTLDGYEGCGVCDIDITGEGIHVGMVRGRGGDGYERQPSMYGEKDRVRN
jgi:hypothetical protein